jgi:hypothetical protein
VRRALHKAGYRWKRPRFVMSRPSPTWRHAKENPAGVRGLGADCGLLHRSQHTDRDTPSRASWARADEKAEVSTTGDPSEWVVFGALNIDAGMVSWARPPGGNKLVSRPICGTSTRCGWAGTLVLFLGRGSPHTPKASRALAAECGSNWACCRRPVRSRTRWKGCGGWRREAYRPAPPDYLLRIARAIDKAMISLPR